MKALINRNLKELLRDPVSSIFCLGFPLLMLAIMSIVNSSIPPEANMRLFEIGRLCPGIAVFSLSFTMLLAALMVSRDRGTALLWRLRASPLQPRDYLAGYLAPLLIMALGQLAICMAASQIVAAAENDPMPAAGLIRMSLSLFPAMVLMVSLGILLGALLPERAAPGVSSILISVSSVLSGVWMDIDGLGGGIQKLSSALPFYHCVRAGRLALLGTAGALEQTGISAIWAVALCLGACLTLRQVLKKDL